jgi:hypothetical protein
MSTFTLCEEQTVYLALTDKAVVLGQYTTREDAEKEVAYYTHETGTPAFVDEVTLFKKEYADD